MKKIIRSGICAVLVFLLAFSAPVLAAESYPAAATETGDGYYIYQTEYFYSGNISENVAADLQPGEKLEIPLSSNSDFVPGQYYLTIYSCGNREKFDILVNGEKVGTVERNGTGFGQNQMTYDKLTTALTLKAEDTVTLVAPGGEYWGWVDHIILDVDEHYTPEEKPADPVEKPDDQPAEPVTKTETGDGYFRWQGEAYYAKTPDGWPTVADLQPGENIAFPLSDNPDFTAGTYTLTVFSCGNRESIEVLVNGQSVGKILRSGTNFGLDQLTDDQLMVALELKPEDVLTIVGPTGAYYGWVDYITLTSGYEQGPSMDGNAVETGDGYVCYQAEYFYQMVAKNAYANLKAGTTIDIPLNTYEAFEDGWYTITVRSSGSRESMYLRVNGKVIGSVFRLASDCSEEGMSEDRYKVKVELKAGDVITLVAPSDGASGWVDWVRLNQVDPPAGANTTPSETAPPEQQTEPTVSQPENPDGGNGTVIIVAGAVAIVLVAAGVVFFVIRKKKSM